MPRAAAKVRGIFERPVGSGVWWIHFHDADGKRHREKAGTRSAAIDLLAKRRGDKVKGVKLPSNLRSQGLIFGRLIDDALEHSRAENSPDTTRELELKYDILRPLLGSKTAISINKQDIVRMLTALHEEREWSGATYNRWLAAISLAFRVGIDNEKIDRNPAAGIKRRRESKGRVLFLSEEGEAKLTAIIKRRCPHNLPAFLISIHCGQRSSEQFRGMWEDVSFDRPHMLTVRVTKTKDGPDRRYVPINSLALEAFRELRAASKNPYIYSNRRGKQLGGHRDWFDPCLAEADLGEYSWHCNRHTFASRLVMKGVPLRSVGELMGHSNQEMTRRYAHLSPEHLLAAVELLVPASAQTATITATSGNVREEQQR